MITGSHLSTIQCRSNIDTSHKPHNICTIIYEIRRHLEMFIGDKDFAKPEKAGGFKSLHHLNYMSRLDKIHYIIINLH